MDYKEKIELARDWYNDQSTTNKEKLLLEKLFPEIIESEDERIRKALIKIVNGIYQDNVDYAYVEDGITYEQLFAYLEKQGEKKLAWSEEDERHCRYIIDFYLQKSYGATAIAIEWLENLKNRVQPHWKPTDDQMQALEFVVQYHAFADQDKREKIVALFNDLKKL